MKRPYSLIIVFMIALFAANIIGERTILTGSKKRIFSYRDQIDLLNTLQNVNKHLVELKQIIEKILAQDRHRIFQLISFIFKNEDFFINPALEINRFKQFDDWFNISLSILLDYISKWDRNSSFSSKPTPTKTTTLELTTTTNSSSCDITTSTKITKTTTPSTIVLTTSMPNCVYSISSTLLRPITIPTTISSLLVDVRICKKYTIADCFSSDHHSEKPINWIPLVCKLLCNKKSFKRKQKL